MQPPLDEQPLPNPAIDLGKLPPEDIPLVLNSIVNEALLGFKRELDGAGQWAWTGVGADGNETTELFDLVRDDLLAFDMLTRFCSRQEPPYGFQVNYIPHIPGKNPSASWAVYILRPDQNGQPSTLAHVNAKRLGPAIALALCFMVGANVQIQHRLLFPGKYLAIAH